MLKNDPGLAGVGIAKAFNKQTNNKHGRLKILTLYQIASYNVVNWDKM